MIRRDGAIGREDLSSAEKHDVLRRLDRYRKWQSLDDKRYCLACGQIIDGHDILVVGGTRGTGPLRLICPTHDCHSIPMDWVIPTTQVLARMSMLQEEGSLAQRAVAGRGKSLPSGCANCAMQFRQRLKGVFVQVQRV